MNPNATNVVFAGLGGQGVLKASDILADAVFRAGLDIKKSEIHGMSQRGGSVASDVRFGREVLSPMVPAGAADFLVVLEATQVEPNQHVLKPGGTMLTPDMIDQAAMANKRSLNVALLGALSELLDIDQSCWEASLAANLPSTAAEMNAKAFELGREAGKKLKTKS